MFVVFAANAVVVAVAVAVVLVVVVVVVAAAAAVAHTLGPVRNPPLQKNAFSHEGDNVATMEMDVRGMKLQFWTEQINELQ